MRTLYDSHRARNVPCDIVRIASIDFNAVHSSWIKGFQLRRSAGFRDGDELLWYRGFLSDTGFFNGNASAGYAVQACDEVQGIVVIERDLRESRTQPSSGVAYVRYLACAPWNRRGDEARAPRFRGTGRLLVVLGIEESRRMACEGRIGLHSFAGAAPFYERLGFRNLGPDAAQRGMSYFELHAKSARTLFDNVTGESC